ncbi:DUF1380 family protein [Pantoea agglomerans]|uniref:Uncharacterized protein DUF1380 n=1 Tax=Enterobacter agglomerans TaxID=549 RepID=A0ABD6XK47_ENTAG|nr:DUF1380 family protein [Pantoea agglomerans]NKE96754.1 DUF1380 family protein [Pantoea agglomerans]QTC52522.1 DUF1380 family protein [Pantoea agglomerans]TRO71617.1 DUF1380 domain-containing protein [Pantoea agglomerans]WNK33303.1 DUF1380 family protein [Pantoea agglomerans]
MYGTVSQLCNRLKAQFEGDQKITLIIWRKEDVMRVMGEEHVTGETAAEIVCDLATWDRDAKHEAGVGAETLRILADNIRHSAGWRNRPVTLSASDVEILVKAAGRQPVAGAGKETDAIQEALRRAYLAVNQ